MYQRMSLCLLFFFALMVNAQTINLHGKVSNPAGKPIDKAIVTLANQGLKDTTGADGAYSILNTTPVVMPISLVPRLQTIVLEKGFLEFSLPDPSPVKIEIFDVKGKLLKKEVLKNGSKGFYRFNIDENTHSAKLLIIRTSIDQDVFTFRYLPFKGKYLLSQSNTSSIVGSEKIAKLAAISDSLKVTATGYTTKAIAITSYEQEMNITLDSVNGSVKRSSGCGKTTSLKGEQTLTISSGGQNRTYMVRLPADYDPNTPYKLWFALHPRGGTAAGVASGSQGTNYQYYGIWKFANPTNGKGTTIFCAPQGNSNQWSNDKGSDVQLVRSLIKKFESELCIDESRIFSEGFSMGGSMSYALACAMPDTFRAICMHSGGNMSGCDGAKRGSVPIFITHGTQDGVCTWPNYGQPQINDLATRDGCTTEDLAAKCKPTDNMHPVCVDYKNCKTGYPCKACIFKGDHTNSPGTEGPWGEGNTWVDDSTWSYFRQFY